MENFTFCAVTMLDLLPSIMENQPLVERYVMQCYFILFYSIPSKAKTGR